MSGERGTGKNQTARNLDYGTGYTVNLHRAL